MLAIAVASVEEFSRKTEQYEKEDLMADITGLWTTFETEKRKF